MLADENIRLELLNLHDAYMNANLVWAAMLRSPVVADGGPHHFMTSDRARFERLWWALIAVYLESWASDRMRPIRQYVASVADIKELNELVKQARRQPLKDKLHNVRGYMFHRDRRTYQDPGRFAPIENLQAMNELHIAFGKMMLVALGADIAAQSK